MLLIANCPVSHFFCLAVQSLWKKWRWGQRTLEKSRDENIWFLDSCYSTGEECGPPNEGFCHRLCLVKVAFPGSPLRIAPTLLFVILGFFLNRIFICS